MSGPKTHSLVIRFTRLRVTWPIINNPKTNNVAATIKKANPTGSTTVRTASQHNSPSGVVGIFSMTASQPPWVSIRLTKGITLKSMAVEYAIGLPIVSSTPLVNLLICSFYHHC